MKFKRLTFAVAAALTIAPTFAFAQSDVSGGVASALNRVHAAVSALTATVNQLLTSVNQLVAANNVTPAVVSKLTTSPVFPQPGGSVACSMFNAGTSPVNISIRVGSVVGSANVGPGLAASINFGAGAGACEFTLVNGASLASVRASLILLDAAANPLLLAEAR